MIKTNIIFNERLILFIKCLQFYLYEKMDFLKFPANYEKILRVQEIIRSYVDNNKKHMLDFTNNCEITNDDYFAIIILNTIQDYANKTSWDDVYESIKGYKNIISYCELTGDDDSIKCACSKAINPKKSFKYHIDNKYGMVIDLDCDCLNIISHDEFKKALKPHFYYFN